MSPPPSTEHVTPRLAAALDQLGEGIIVTNETGKIIFINAAALSINGLKRDSWSENRQQEFGRLLTMAGDPYPYENLPLTRAAIKGETVENAFWQIEHENGEVVVALGTARPVFDGHGQQIGAVLTLRDETEREAERRALQSAVALKDMLLKEIHHRVKNNLQLVSSLLNLQGRKTSDPVTSEALSDLSSRVDIIADIHRALYDSGETDTIEVVSYLRRLCESSLRPLLESFDFTFETGISGLWVLPIEKATSLALALNELVLNSIKHACSNTGVRKISLTVERHEDTLRIDFQDTSIGRSAFISPSDDRVGFGRLLVEGLEKQLSANISRNVAEGGNLVVIKIPVEDNLVTTD